MGLEGGGRRGGGGGKWSELLAARGGKPSCCRHGTGATFGAPKSWCPVVARLESGFPGNGSGSGRGKMRLQEGSALCLGLQSKKDRSGTLGKGPGAPPDELLHPVRLSDHPGVCTATRAHTLCALGLWSLTRFSSLGLEAIRRAGGAGGYF